MHLLHQQAAVFVHGSILLLFFLEFYHRPNITTNLIIPTIGLFIMTTYFLFSLPVASSINNILLFWDLGSLDMMWEAYYLVWISWAPYILFLSGALVASSTVGLIGVCKLSAITTIDNTALASKLAVRRLVGVSNDWEMINNMCSNDQTI